MTKQNQIKVFKPNSKQADFTVRSVTVEAGSRKLGEVLDQDAAKKATQAFRSLKRLGAESMSFRHGNRRMKIELAQSLQAA